MCQPCLSLGTSSYLVTGVGCITVPYSEEEMCTCYTMIIWRFKTLPSPFDLLAPNFENAECVQLTKLLDSSDPALSHASNDGGSANGSSMTGAAGGLSPPSFFSPLCLLFFDLFLLFSLRSPVGVVGESFLALLVGVVGESFLAPELFGFALVSPTEDR